MTSLRSASTALLVAALGSTTLVAATATAAVPSPAQTVARAVSTAQPVAVAIPAKKKKAKKAKIPSYRPTTPPRPVGTLQRTSFGIHSFLERGTVRPQVGAEAFRLNCVPLWRMLNPSQGVFNWAPATELIQRNINLGYRDIMFSFCGTPKWAARKPVINPNREYYGEYSTAAPVNMAYWRDFVRGFVSRYRNYISAYETWNEATAQFLWQGTPDEMAQMTKILYDTVRELDPTAKVISANSQMGEQPAWFRSFFPKYMKGLAARGWPVDVVAIHSYAGHPTKISPEVGIGLREKVLDEFVAAAKAAKIPSRVQFWDTETNYLGTATGRLQQALTVRTYLDSWRHGFSRTYWYKWVDKPYPWLGIQMMPGAPAVVAYNTLMEWTVGAAFRGCADTGTVEVCQFQRGGTKFKIAYGKAYKGRHAVKLAGPAKVCEPTGAACTRARSKVMVGYMPVKIG